jgi:hypothetical protein
VADGDVLHFDRGDQLITIHARGAPGSDVRSDSKKTKDILRPQEIVSQAVVQSQAELIRQASART